MPHPPPPANPLPHTLAHPHRPSPTAADSLQGFQDLFNGQTGLLVASEKSFGASTLQQLLALETTLLDAAATLAELTPTSGRTAKQQVSPFSFAAGGAAAWWRCSLCCGLPGGPPGPPPGQLRWHSPAEHLRWHMLCSSAAQKPGSPCSPGLCCALCLATPLPCRL